MREWRRRFPDRRLVLVCRKGLGGHFRDEHLADEVIEIDKKNPKAWKDLQEALLARIFEDVLCPHPSFRSAWLVRKLKVNGVRVGFSTWWNRGLFDVRVERPDHLPDALRQLSLLSALSYDFAEEFSQFAQTPGVANEGAEAELLDFRKTPIPEWASLHDSAGKGVVRTRRILIAPGSVWATKRWTEEGFAEVARVLLGRGYEICLVGGADEREIGERIASRVEGVENRMGRTSIPELVELMRESLLLIGNDSGAIHVAARSNLPTVAIFGPTVPGQGFRPWLQASILVQKSLPCRPCGRHGHQKCPIGTHECMKSVTPSLVLGAAQKLLTDSLSSL